MLDKWETDDSPQNRLSFSSCLIIPSLLLIMHIKSVPLKGGPVVWNKHTFVSDHLQLNTGSQSWAIRYAFTSHQVHISPGWKASKQGVFDGGLMYIYNDLNNKTDVTTCTAVSHNSIETKETLAREFQADILGWMRFHDVLGWWISNRWSSNILKCWIK